MKMSNNQLRYRLIGIAVPPPSENEYSKYKPWAARYDKNYKREKVKSTSGFRG